MSEFLAGLPDADEPEDAAVTQLLVMLTDILTTVNDPPSFGTCTLCGQPIDIGGLCINVDCKNYLP